MNQLLTFVLRRIALWTPLTFKFALNRPNHFKPLRRNMKNWDSAKANYLQRDRPQQLGSIASSLKRIGTNIQFRDEPGYQVAFAAIEECQHLTEWLITTLNLQGDELDLSLAETLLQVGRQASQWKYEWQQCCQNNEKCKEVATISEQWSERMLERSGLSQVEPRQRTFN
jgi:hypothetical protein